MSKCSVFRILKSKCSHCTLFLPKYWAFAVDARTTRREKRTTTDLRIETHLEGSFDVCKRAPAASSLPCGCYSCSAWSVEGVSSLETSCQFSVVSCPLPPDN